MTPAVALSAKQPRVLLVEDEDLIRSVFGEALRDAGCMVLEAGRADEALAYMRAGEEVDLVFSDVCMPGAFDGVELARVIGALKPALPVILTSGNLNPDIASRLRFFLPKPYRIDRAIAAVFEALGQEPPER